MTAANDPIKRPTRAVAIATMARALRAGAEKLGYHPDDTLIALMLAQMVGAEGTMPGLWDGAGYTLRGTNNVGASQVLGASQGPAFAASHKNGWGAFAHYDSNPGDPYLGWYLIAPTVQDAADHWLGGYAGVTAVLQQDPQDPQAYATIMHERGYYTGTSTDADTDIAAYAGAIERALPEVTAAMNGPSNDPTVPSVDPTLFASLASRRITEDLYNKAMAGQSGGAWKWLLPSWSKLQASNGVVWFGNPPGGIGSSLPWKSALALGVAGALVAGPVGLVAGVAAAVGHSLLAPHLPALPRLTLPAVQWPWRKS